MAMDSKFLRGDLLIMAAALIWGVAFYFQKTAMGHIGPLLFIGLRGMIAAIALVPFALLENRAKPGTSSKGLLRLAGAAGCIFFMAASIQQMGIVTATVTNTGFLTALYVVVTPFLFWVIKGQAPSRLLWLSTLLALCGVWALSGGAAQGLSKGDILVAGSAAFWGLLIVVSGEAGRFGRPMTYTCLQFFIVGFLGLFAAFWFEPVALQNIKPALVSVLYVGLLSTALTFGIMAIALQYVPAPRASILLSLETLFAALAGHALLGERLNALGWMGAFLILSAVFILQIRRSEAG